MSNKARKQLPYFPFYPADWIASPAVRQMLPEQIGAYIMLLAWAWQSEDCGLPADQKTLLKLSQLCTKRAGKLLLNGVLVQFRRVGERYYNDRLLAIRKEQQAYRDQKVEAGRAGAAARWEDGGCHSSAIPPPMAKRWRTDGSSSSSSSSKKSSESTHTDPTETPQTGHGYGQLCVCVRKAWEDWAENQGQGRIFVPTPKALDELRRWFSRCGLPACVVATAWRVYLSEASDHPSHQGKPLQTFTANPDKYVSRIEWEPHDACTEECLHE